MKRSFTLRNSSAHRSGFTLLELLVVVAILAIIAGSLIAAYDGLESKSAQGVATYDIGALDSSIRSFAATNGSFFPNEWDSLLTVDDSTAPTSATYSPLNILPDKLNAGGLESPKLGLHTLTSEGVAALGNAGITVSRYVDEDNFGYDNSLSPAENTDQQSIPNRVFDNPTRGFGAPVNLQAGVGVAAVESLTQPDFDNTTPSDSSRLRDIGGLDETVGHIVVAFGIGNNSTLVHSTERFDRRAASLSEAPFYKNIPPTNYGRYIALFHIATDTVDGSGAVGPNGAIDSGDYFEEARFVGVIDTRGDWYDEEEAEFTGMKD